MSIDSADKRRSAAGFYVRASGGSTSTDPGVANVLFGVEYNINGTDLVGTYDETLRFSDPGVANVRTLTPYKYQGSNKVGTLIPTIGLGGSNRIVSDGKNLQLI